MAAGVGISNKEFIIVLYDCDLDTLTVSAHVPVRTPTEIFLAASFQLWIVLHYRRYCRNMRDKNDFIVESQLTSGSHNFVKKQDVLHIYQTLSSYQENNVDCQVRTPAEETSHGVYLHLPKRPRVN